MHYKHIINNDLTTWKKDEKTLVSQPMTFAGERLSTLNCWNSYAKTEIH